MDLRNDDPCATTAIRWTGLEHRQRRRGHRPATPHREHEPVAVGERVRRVEDLHRPDAERDRERLMEYTQFTLPDRPKLRNLDVRADDLETYDALVRHDHDDAAD